MPDDPLFRGVASPPSDRCRPFQGNLPRLLSASVRVKHFFAPLPASKSLLTRGGRVASGVRRHLLGHGARQANLPILRLVSLLVNPSPLAPCPSVPVRRFGDKKICSVSAGTSATSLVASSGANHPLTSQRGARSRRFTYATDRGAGCQPLAMRIRKLSFLPLRMRNSSPSIAWSTMSRSFSSVTRRLFT